MPVPASALQVVCISGVYVCAASSRMVNVQVGRLAERRMTHLPRGSKLLHHHQLLLAVEQMSLYSHQTWS